jgi:hypothetical protein
MNVPVDEFGDGCSTVTDKLRDLFDRDGGVEERRDE